MWCDVIKKIIEKEFPFIELYKDSLTSYRYHSNKGKEVIINIQPTIMVIGYNGSIKCFREIDGVDIIDKIYDALPKEFYLPHKRSIKINEILK